MPACRAGKVLVQCSKLHFSLGTLPRSAIVAALLRLHWGSFASPDPIQSSTAEAVSSTSCSRWLDVRRWHSSSVPMARPEGRPWELPLRPPSSLATSRRAAGKPAYSRSLIVSSRMLAPVGAAPGASSSLAQQGGSAAPSLTLPPIVQAAKAAFSPLVVLAGVTFGCTRRASVLGCSPSRCPRGRHREPSSSSIASLAGSR